MRSGDCGSVLSVLQTGQMSTDELDDPGFISTAVVVSTTEFSRSETRDTSFLIEAIVTGDGDAVRRLLAAGQDPNMVADWSRFATVPPLALALQAREIGIARTLVQHGADAMAGFDEDGFSSAMSSAICHGGEEAVQLLLDAGHPVTRGALLLAANRIVSLGARECSLSRTPGDGRAGGELGAR